MPRGTTPTHTFTLPFAASLVRSCRITYAQDGQVVLRKETGDCVIAGDAISVKLTQEDTFKFTDNSRIQIQLRVLTTDGTALKTPVYVKYAQECLDDEVLT